jgi:cytochrome c biogenesis protein CcmG/thiol:disulfide interchange protein DsbE
LSQLRGQVVIINFWASWCPPCREEAAYLEQTWRKYEDKGVIFIGVDWVDTQKEALAYMKEFDLTYFNGPDLGTRVAEAYRIKGVPETFFVAKNGARGVHWAIKHRWIRRSMVLAEPIRANEMIESRTTG